MINLSLIFENLKGSHDIGDTQHAKTKYPTFW